MLTRLKVLTVLLCIDLQSEWQHKNKHLGGYRALYYSLLLYSILNIAIIAKCILLKFAPIMSAFCSLLLYLPIFIKHILAKLMHPILNAHVST